MAEIGEVSVRNRQSRQEIKCIRLSKRMDDQVAGLRRLASDSPSGSPEFGDVLELSMAEVVDLEIEPSLDLPVGLLGEADRARLGDAVQARGDVGVPLSSEPKRTLSPFF